MMYHRVYVGLKGTRRSKITLKAVNFNGMKSDTLPGMEVHAVDASTGEAAERLEVQSQGQLCTKLI